ncbi:hypothetical protein Btru_047508 [Bulinus truncatus]|nr:hypothetical protein Btru_047508 [Bulinus truncatus]
MDNITNVGASTVLSDQRLDKIEDTDCLFSSLNNRLEAMDLYTTEMFDEELFLVGTMIVAVVEAVVVTVVVAVIVTVVETVILAVVIDLVVAVVIDMAVADVVAVYCPDDGIVLYDGFVLKEVIDEPLHSTVSTTDNNNISHLSTGVCSAKQLEEFEASLDSTEFKDSSSSQAKESVSSNVSVEETAESNIPGQVMLVSEVAKSQQMKSNVEIATLPHSSGSSHSSKVSSKNKEIAKSGQGSVNKGHHPGINGLKPTDSQKRTNQMTKVYGDGESVSKKFKGKIAEKLNELKIKIEKNNEMNKLILNVRTIK